MHPFYLAFGMQDEDAVCLVLLHDVVEDYGDTYPFERLQREGFGEEILTALRLLTRDDAVLYEEYVGEIGKNELARKVKIADLYRWALAYLTSL